MDELKFYKMTCAGLLRENREMADELKIIRLLVQDVIDIPGVREELDARRNSLNDVLKQIGRKEKPCL